METILAFQRWKTLCTNLGISSKSTQSLFDDLIRKYGESSRYYHTLSHVLFMLTKLDAAAWSFCELDQALGLPTRESLELAVWFHDSIYNSKRKNNEAQSALWAAEQLTNAGVKTSIVHEAVRIIHLSQDHDPKVEDKIGQRFCDLDLAILSAPKEEYRAFSAAVRKEYRHVPVFLYRRGRKQVLAKFLDRSRLYWTAYFEQFEHQARANLQMEMAQL
jgi:predicted metal-dependent HD superfamily phosphohydrolase